MLRGRSEEEEEEEWKVGGEEGRNVGAEALCSVVVRPERERERREG